MICKGCGERLEAWELETVNEWVSYRGREVLVPVDTLCPVCGGSEFALEGECAECGRMTDETALRDGLCPACAREAEEMWREMTPAQRKYLLGLDEGE